MSLNINTEKKAKNTIAFVYNDKKKVANLTIDYDDVSNNNNSITLHDNNTFELCPRPVNERERDVLFIAGESGSGKSYYAREYAKKYKAMFPENEIFLISYLEHDETLDEYKEITRLDCFNNNFMSSCEKLNIENEFSNCFVIFDDIDSITNKKEKQTIFALLNKLLRIGRHYNTSVAYLGHELYNSSELKTIMNESFEIVFFPRYLNYKKLKYLLEEYFGLSKTQIERIKNIRDRSVTYIKGSDKIIMSNKQAFTIQANF